VKKYVLDANCYIDASRSTAALTALTRFSAWSAPSLFLSSVVAAELRAGATTVKKRKELEDGVLAPFVRRGRVFTPSSAAWDALALTLATLRVNEGLQLSEVKRSFALDVLLAYSCRERGAILITKNSRDMKRIRSAFAFEFVEPYPIGHERGIERPGHR
jgi:predicted nucleic acid-binding protein